MSDSLAAVSNLGCRADEIPDEIDPSLQFRRILLPRLVTRSTHVQSYKTSPLTVPGVVRRSYTQQLRSLTISSAAVSHGHG